MSKLKLSISVVLSAWEDGKFVEVNESFTETFGFSREEVISKNATDLNLWKDPSEQESLVARVKSGEEVRNESVRLRAKNGKELEIIFNMIVINKATKPMVLSFGNPLTDNISVNRKKLPRSKSSKIALPTSYGFMFVKISEIVYLKASGNYTNVFLKNNQTYLVTRQLHDFEEILKSFNFFRIHHSTLIQIDYLEKYVRSDGGYVVMSNDTSLNISRRKKDSFLARVGCR
jgi:PAS domain S-box-containing protein